MDMVASFDLFRFLLVFPETSDHYKTLIHGGSSLILTVIITKFQKLFSRESFSSHSSWATFLSRHNILTWFSVLCPHTIPPTVVLCSQPSLHSNHRGLLSSVRTPFHLPWFCVLSPHSIPTTVVYCPLSAHYSTYRGFVSSALTPFQQPWFIVLCPHTIPPTVVLFLHFNRCGLLFFFRTPFQLPWSLVLSTHSIPTTVV
ncbi:unnamed protein product [Acanthosepion pharaonis]|uniref:Uncharacterized protein n=1 Tax=Acanthosepion pharaonis TaxID=158019 RepID=A0A812AYQ2_ACAPH|nr:unnamed protein product [Sepia pharaonis]